MIFLGGGVLSEYIVPRVAEILDYDFTVPRFHEVAGAVGCAVSRVSLRARVHADTAQGLMTVNGSEKDIEKGRELSGDEWKKVGKEEALKLSRKAGGSSRDLDGVSINSLRYFNVVERKWVKGQICDIECQVEPGISREFDLEKLRGESS